MRTATGILAVDIGSSSLRVTLFDGELQPVDTRTEKHATRSHADVAGYWVAIEAMIRRLTQDHGARDIRAVGVSSMLGWVMVDAGGNPVSPAYTWMDHRPEQQRVLAAAMDEQDFSRRTGRRLSPELGGLKLRHLKETEPEHYARAAALLSFKDYINFRLCGSFAMDRTMACYTGLYNIHTRSWDADICAALGLDMKKLPALYGGSSAIGHIDGERAAALGLSGPVPVAAGGPDGSVAVLGAGGMRPGDAVTVMGTSDVFFAVAEELVQDPNRHVVTNPHVLPGLWLVGGPLGMAGGALGWYAGTLLDGKRSLSELNALAAAVPPGAGDLVFVPSLTGERTPFWNGAVRGTVAGLTREHGPGHLFRALMEANSFAIRRIVDVLAELGVPVARMSAIGGGAGNELWLAIKADVCGVAIGVPESLEATSRGCAVLAWLAAHPDAPPPPAPPVSSSHEADAERGRLYEPHYRRYLKIMALCDEIYGET